MKTDDEMIMKLYEQLSKHEHPEQSGWYNTDKGLLFWFSEEEEWSCREDKLSVEYPIVWYKEFYLADISNRRGIVIGHVDHCTEDIARIISENKDNFHVVVVGGDQLPKANLAKSIEMLSIPDIDFTATEKPKRKGYERPYKYHR